MTSTFDDLYVKAINTLRTLAIDAVENARAGHPGMPMGAAPMAYVLWTQMMRHNPENAEWFNRDRFVLSAGHGSMLLYGLLHLCGYPLTLDDIKQFRQFASRTPGHPEVGHTPGVEATTGPLGQGLGMAVGMAMAEAHLAATYNRPEFPLVDHHTFVLCGDGDLMEGVSGEAASFAGHLRLGKLIVLYDSNDITLDGELSLSSSDDVRPRFQSYGWEYIRVPDETDLSAIALAIATAKANRTQPTLIEVKTTIGYGSPNKAGKGGHAGPHGTPLGAQEAKLTKTALGWPDAPDFLVPADVRAHFADVAARGRVANAEWDALFARYCERFPQHAHQFQAALKQELPDDWHLELPTFAAGTSPISTRAASGLVLNHIAARVPWVMGGAADVESSTMTHLHELGQFSAAEYASRNVYFGVREFGMAAAVNGMTLHGGVRAFGSTFFVFSDYLRPALRLAAIMGVPSIFVFTHDSIAVGEDGPTHQPVEQLLALRAIPNLTVIRSADATETVAAWQCALAHRDGPVCLVLSRQELPVLAQTTAAAIAGVARGAYVVSDAYAGMGRARAVIIASGSEVHLALAAQTVLAAEGVPVRVVSMPSWELFGRQDNAYQRAVLPPDIRCRLAVEAGLSLGWERFVGDGGDVLSINHFGLSGKGAQVMEHFGFTVENVVLRVRALLRRFSA